MQPLRAALSPSCASESDFSHVGGRTCRLCLHGLQRGRFSLPGILTSCGRHRSMYIGNVMLLILNLPLVGLWARLSLVPINISRLCFWCVLHRCLLKQELDV